MSAVTCLQGLDPHAYSPHNLHGSQRNWPETNCYVDLWIEVLHALGLPVEAVLGFTVTQDFEGDQFTFFKFPPEDLAQLFDLTVQELAIYDRVESHTLEQLQRGRLVLIEVDSYYLPDTQGTSYGVTHGKTTIGVNHLDPVNRRMHYFHNAGYFALQDKDFDGIFRPDSPPGSSSAALFPYVEFVKFGDARPASIIDVSIQLLKSHLRKRPPHNPITLFQHQFPEHARMLGGRPMEFFHLYAFNTLRQLGANFELMASHLLWLLQQGEANIEKAIAPAMEITTGAKTLQFQLARAMARKQFDKLAEMMRPLAGAYDTIFNVLTDHY